MTEPEEPDALDRVEAFTESFGDRDLTVRLTNDGPAVTGPDLAEVVSELRTYRQIDGAFERNAAVVDALQDYVERTRGRGFISNDVISDLEAILNVGNAHPPELVSTVMKIVLGYHSDATEDLAVAVLDAVQEWSNQNSLDTPEPLESPGVVVLSGPDEQARPRPVIHATRHEGNPPLGDSPAAIEARVRASLAAEAEAAKHPERFRVEPKSAAEVAAGDPNRRDAAQLLGLRRDNGGRILLRAEDDE